MSFHSHQQRFGWQSGFVLVVIALLLLPMAPGSIVDRNAQVLGEDQPKQTKKIEKKTPYPTIVKTIPEIGATDVPVGLKEIKVVFDRKMQKGMSPTGDPAEMPPFIPTRKPYWSDARTWVMPVQLEKGNFYRMGLNSQSYQNFKSADGVPIPSTPFFFVTAGATQEVKDRARIPKVVKFEPDNGDQMVDPEITQITVTFDVPMGAGMSWVGSGDSHPGTAEGEKAKWSEDKLTCILPVKLKPDHHYEVGINNAFYDNFQSENRIPAASVTFSFRTRK